MIKTTPIFTSFIYDSNETKVIRYAAFTFSTKILPIRFPQGKVPVADFQSLVNISEARKLCSAHRVVRDNFSIGYDWIICKLGTYWTVSCK
jgi:hypothetical protein